MNRRNGGKPQKSKNLQGANQNMRQTLAPNGQRQQSAQNTSPNAHAQPQRGKLGAQKPVDPKARDLLKPSKKKKTQTRKAPKTPDNKPKANAQRTNPAPQTNTSTKKAQSPKKEIDKRASAAAAKAMNTKHSAPVRQKFRGGNYILYYLLFAVIVIIVLIILANTVLFNCKVIEVRGMARYLPDQVIEVSRLRTGDNLLHIDKDKAEKRIVAELAYIDAAHVEASFPTKIIITVTEAERWFCISQNGVNAIISRGGKILEKGETGGLPVITGYEAESLETGSRLTSKVEGKKSIPEEILNAADKAGVTNIDSIDMSDRYSINVVVDGRITLELGAITNIETKMLAAYKLIEEEISPSENVTVLLNNPEKIAVHTNRPAEPPVASQPEQSSDNPENSTASE